RTARSAVTAATTTTARAATAAASRRRTAQRAWRCGTPGSTFFRKATRAFWIFRQILFTLDAGCLGLFVSGRPTSESQRHIQIASERVCDGHRSRQCYGILNESFINDVVRILERELFDDMRRVAMDRT